MLQAVTRQSERPLKKLLTNGTRYETCTGPFLRGRGSPTRCAGWILPSLLQAGGGEGRAPSWLLLQTRRLSPAAAPHGAGRILGLHQCPLGGAVGSRCPLQQHRDNAPPGANRAVQKWHKRFTGAFRVESRAEPSLCWRNRAEDPSYPTSSAELKFL